MIQEQVSGGSNNENGPQREITLPDTVDPVAVENGECSFDPVSDKHCLNGDLESCTEPENAKFLYEVVEPQDEVNSGRRVKITARPNGSDLGVPWTATIMMICPGRRCSFYFSHPHVIVIFVFLATLSSFLFI